MENQWFLDTGVIVGVVGSKHYTVINESDLTIFLAEGLSSYEVGDIGALYVEPSEGIVAFRKNDSLLVDLESMKERYFGRYKNLFPYF